MARKSLRVGSAIAELAKDFSVKDKKQLADLLRTQQRAGSSMSTSAILWSALFTQSGKTVKRLSFRALEHNDDDLDKIMDGISEFSRRHCTEEDKQTQGCWRLYCPLTDSKIRILTSEMALYALQHAVFELITRRLEKFYPIFPASGPANGHGSNNHKVSWQGLLDEMMRINAQLSLSNGEFPVLMSSAARALC